MNFNIVNFLSSLVLVGTFPIYLLTELLGIQKIYFSVFAALNILTLLTKKISIKLRYFDVSFLIYIGFIIIYSLIDNNGLNEENYVLFAELFTRVLIPYISGRILYQYLNNELFKYIILLALFYFVILVALFIYDSQGFFTNRFETSLIVVSEDYIETFYSIGSSYIILTLYSYLKNFKNIDRNFKLLISTLLIIFSLLAFQISNRKYIIGLLILLFINNYKKFWKVINNFSLNLKYAVKYLLTSSIILIFLGNISRQRISHFLELKSLSNIFADRQTFCESITNSQSFSSITARISYLKTSFAIIKDNFFFGIGPQNFKEYTCIANKNNYDGNFLGSHPHNIFLHSISELGIFISLILITNFIFLLIKVHSILKFKEGEEFAIDNLIFLFWQLELALSFLTYGYNKNFFLAFITGLCISLIYKNKYIKQT